MTSLREALRARTRPTATVRLPVDPAGYADALREVDAARLALASAVGDRAAPQARMADAQQRLDAVEVLTVDMRALAAADWEALVEAHPPSDEQRSRGADVNMASFRPALLAASVVVADGDQGLTEVEWAELAGSGQVAAGELELLFGTAVTLNTRSPQVSTGKGW